CEVLLEENTPLDRVDVVQNDLDGRVPLAPLDSALGFARHRTPPLRRTIDWSETFLNVAACGKASTRKQKVLDPWHEWHAAPCRCRQMSLFDRKYRKLTVMDGDWRRLAFIRYVPVCHGERLIAKSWLCPRNWQDDSLTCCAPRR